MSSLFQGGCDGGLIDKVSMEEATSHGPVFWPGRSRAIDLARTLACSHNWPKTRTYSPEEHDVSEEIK